MESLTRALGRGGPQVSAVGLGFMSLGGAYAQKNTLEERLAFLDRAHEVGSRFWDTADAYADTEELIGKWFARSGKRADIFVATKGAMDRSTGVPVVRSNAAYLKGACERSLKKLGVDYIDLYYAHRVAYETPIEETIMGLVELIKEGKIRHIGLSEVSSETLRRAHAVHPIAAVQVEYSPFTLDLEDPKIDLLNTCRELGVALVAYSPLGRGFLTGQIKKVEDLVDPNRKTIPRYAGENFPRVLDIVETLEDIGRRKGVSSSQITIAWVLAQDELIIPIPGTRTVKYLEQNTEAGKVTLDPEEIREIRDVVEKANLSGSRTYPGYDDFLFSDTKPL
ncbi:hypothetical protein V494_08433 [Pseudogymnoascus sp. VKM F-4513 (FW-928)]|nr:hypothetical protein V494_08433 [Pseudogymnoascus sp. VKM F-4513 (FW-928)]